MASKNVLKTMAAITLGKVMADKSGHQNDRIFDAAWNAWRFYPVQKDFDIIINWLQDFDREIWNEKAQEVHTNISFALAILEMQTCYLHGHKGAVMSNIIEYLQSIYEGLESSDADEYECNHDAKKACDVWHTIINQL